MGRFAMRLPVIHGLIRRRLLVNFRVDAEVMSRFLPSPFRPGTILPAGHARACSSRGCLEPARGLSALLHHCPSGFVDRGRLVLLYHLRREVFVRRAGSHPRRSFWEV